MQSISNRYAVIGFTLTLVVLPAKGQTLDATRRHAVVESIAEKLIEGYIYEEQGKQLAALIRDRRDAGHYDELSTEAAFAAALTQDLQEKSHDLHLSVLEVHEVPEGPEEAKGAERPSSPRAFFRSVNYGFPKLEVMRGNVGYLELLAFMGVPEAFERVKPAFGLLQGVDALIIDLRRNGGGEESMLRHFSTYLFDEKTVLYTNWTRGMKEPEDVLTLDLPGPRLGEVPLFVLTSKDTCSAAESFAFAMKINKRGTLVGEPTAGGGHYGGTVPLGNGLTLWLPHGRAYDKRTGRGFEVEGIKPHIAVPAEQALERALVEARKAAKQHAAARNARETRIRAEVDAAITAARELAKAGDLPAARDRLAGAFEAAWRAGLLTEHAVNRIGYQALRDGLYQLAVVIFRLNVEQFPVSSNVYDSLGEAHLKAGEIEPAISNYERSLELDPSNENAKAQLDKLRR